MDVPTLLSTARRGAGLSQRELAARARTSAAAVCLYERGARVPRVDTLQRLIAATGATLALEAPPDPAVDLASRGRDLVRVLDLADALPKRHDPELTFPTMRDLIRKR